MQSEILFEEIQSSGRKSVRDFFRVTAGILLVFLVFNFIQHKAAIDTVTATLFTGFVLSTIISIVVYTKLIMQIRTDGIYVRFPPFQSSFTRYEWESILDIYIRNYDAASEYNGWGIRTGTLGKAYIVSGSAGIQIIFKDKTRLLIGTELPAQVSNVLQQLKKF